LLPYYYKPILGSILSDDIIKIIKWLYYIVFCWLMYLGGQLVETPYFELSQIFTFILFISLLMTFWVTRKGSLIELSTKNEIITT
jgi:hypothetical protein